MINNEKVVIVAKWDSFTNQKQWKEYLQALLKENDTALLRAVVVIYDYQTYEEQLKGEAIEENDVGFSKVDAADLGRIARKVIDRQPLDKGEWARLRNKMPKYWKQLMFVSKAAQVRSKALSEFGYVVEVDSDGQTRLEFA